MISLGRKTESKREELGERHQYLMRRVESEVKTVALE